MKRIKFMLLFLVLFLALPSGSAFAATRNDRVIEAGETVNRDVTVYGGNLVIQKDAIVNGSVFVYGGNTTLAGDINGDVSVFGGNTDLTGSVTGDLVMFGGNLSATGAAKIGGDCVVMGGNLDDETGLLANCTTLTGLPGISRFFAPGEFLERPPAVPRPPAPPAPPGIIYRTGRSPLAAFVGNVGQVFSQSVLLGILALVVAALLPNQLRQVNETIQLQPAASGVVGMLTAIAVPSLAALLAVLSAILILVCIGLLGFPIVILLLMGLVAAALMGWVAIGSLLGERLAAPLKLNNPSMAITAALGTAVLTVVIGLLNILPFYFGGWLVTAILVSVGLGAVTLTQFGAKPYPRDNPWSGNRAKVNDVLNTLPD
jgi:hypothetical protein